MRQKMRKTILIALTAAVMCWMSTETYSKVPRKSDDPQKRTQTEKKTGWEFGVLPCLTYSSDMGFQYGVFGDFYYYGDGSTYPNYRDKISYEASHFTKGLTRLYLAYDSKVLIPHANYLILHSSLFT